MAAISKRYFVIRSVQTIIMFWVVVTVLSFIFRLAPGDYTDIMMAYLFLPSLLMRTSTVEVRGQGFSYYQRVAGIPKR